MKPMFQITKLNAHYVIKKRTYFIFPFTYLKVMNKTDFLPHVNDYAYNFLSQEDATFNSVNECLDALSQWASINGIENIIVKIVNRL